MFETIRAVIAVLAGLVLLVCLTAFVLLFGLVVLVIAGIGALGLRGGFAWGNTRRRDRHRRQDTTAEQDSRRYIEGPLGRAGLIQH